MPGPISAPHIFAGGSERPPEDKPILEHIGKCKQCGKETELFDGLCTECKWEIKVGERHPIAQEKKHHFWSHDKPESQPTATQSQDHSATTTDE